jgi:tetratricopeptide (TPR) repeat protein
VYPEPRVTKFVSEHFEPVRLHVKKHPEAMGRFGANWTPTVMIADDSGKDYYRVEGFLPADDFLAQLKLGYAQYLFKTGRFDEAEKQFREVVDEFPNGDAAAEALYWAGVAKYKGTGDAAALGATAQAFKARYSDTPWAKKASIWG